MSKFEDVSSDDHQVSIAGGVRARVEGTMSHVWEGARAGSYHVSCLAGGGNWSQGEGPCTVRSNASWAMVTWDTPVDRQNDRHT